MTSPNEPGAPEKGDSPNGDGAAERTSPHRATPAPAGHGQDASDMPPWQRGATRAAQATRQHPEPQAEIRPPGPPAGADVRLNRFISGTAAPGASATSQPKTSESEAAPSRGDSHPTEAYGSELPDLSGPTPRAALRKTTPDRAPAGTGTSVRAAAAGAAEAREVRDGRVQVSRRTRGPVRASMQVRRIDPWSTLKVSLMLSVALFFVWMISVAFLYLVLGGMGVWAKLNSNVGDLLNNTSGSSGELVSSGTIFGGAALIGLVNIVLLTAMATLGAFVYNLATDLIGGIEVTLADRD